MDAKNELSSSPPPPTPRAPTHPAKPADPFINERIAGKYRIKRVIAAGGMGRVYEGVQEPIGRPVAVKVIAPPREDQEDHETHAKRFFREASLLGRLSHPNIVVVYDYGTMEGEGHEHPYYLVMEYLQGRTLREVINQEAPLSLERVLRMGLQLCGALHDAHSQGILHRDLKPPNIMLTQRGGDPDFLKIIDFGLVKEINPDVNDEVTSAQNLVGSPLYMAPEQFTKNKTTVQSEIYSVGIILYEMISGHTPFTRSADSMVSDLIIKHVMEPPPPIESFVPDAVLPQELIDAVMRCLEKKPEARFASLTELQEVLEFCYRMILSGDHSAIHDSSLALRVRTGDFPVVDSRTPRAFNPSDSSSLRIAAQNSLTPSAMRRPSPGSPPTAAALTQAEMSAFDPAEHRATPPPAKSKATLIIAIVILLAGGAAAAFMLGQHSSESPANTTDTPSPPAPSANVTESPPLAVNTTPPTANPNPPPALPPLPNPPATNPNPSTINTAPTENPTTAPTANTPTNTPPAINTNPSPPEPAKTPEPPPAPKLSLLVTFSIDSVPPGAVVYDGPKRLGETPISFPIERSSLTDLSPRTFTLRKTGYLEQVYTQGATEEETIKLVMSLPPEPKNNKPPKKNPPPKNPPTKVEPTPPNGTEISTER